MNENKAKVWLARDEDGKLYVYKRRPSKVDNMWISSDIELELHGDCFPSVKWEDEEPTEAYITLTEPQEKKEIDWEQRRYEIAKDALNSLIASIVVENVVDDKEIYAKYAINIANALINELKKQSE